MCHKSIALKEEYKQILRQCFQIKPKSVDFSQVEETVRIMNKDAMDSTDDVIDEVIHEKDITENKNVKLIMIKALFIRGFWATSFDEVIKEDFHFKKTFETIGSSQISSLQTTEGTNRLFRVRDE
jgi:serine protease inhibitor